MTHFNFFETKRNVIADFLLGAIGVLIAYNINTFLSYNVESYDVYVLGRTYGIWSWHSVAIYIGVTGIFAPAMEEWFRSKSNDYFTVFIIVAELLFVIPGYLSDGEYVGALLSTITHIYAHLFFRIKHAEGNPAAAYTWHMTHNTAATLNAIFGWPFGLFRISCVWYFFYKVEALGYGLSKTLED